MNYLVVIFDGLGDGVIYHSFLQAVCGQQPESLFFCVSNLFLSDAEIKDRIGTPANMRSADDTFRKFPKDRWDDIRLFVERNDIGAIINLRFIGKRFEPDYYDFKNWLAKQNTRSNFYDDEALADKEKLNVNVRDIIGTILYKAMKRKVVYDTARLKSQFPASEKTIDVLINFHSRGAFKMWEPPKWQTIISSLASSDKKVHIYEGFGTQEKSDANRILSNLPTCIKSKISVGRPTNLHELGQLLRRTFLLISVDSGLIHFADALEERALGIYTTTSPIVWGGVTRNFRYLSSKHMSTCKNFYPYFGMCMNNKRKCETISFDKDDVDIADILKEIDHIFHEKKN